MIEYLRNRLAEKSTWFAIFAVIAAFSGWELTIDQQIAVAVLGSILAGAPGDTLQRLRKKEPDEHESLDDLISRGRK